VIHYGFENEKDGSTRDANKHDLRILRDTFTNYDNCIYKERKSPLHTEVPKILGDEGMKNIFSHDEGSFLSLRLFCFNLIVLVF